MKNGLLFKMAIITMLLFGGLVALSSYWLLFPYKILTFNEENNILLTPTVKSGGYIQVQRDFCKHMAISAEVSRTFVDSLKYDAVIPSSNEPVGCKKDVLYIYVPKTLPPAMYQVRDVYTYHVNPLRKIEYTLMTTTFQILPKE